MNSVFFLHVPKTAGVSLMAKMSLKFVPWDVNMQGWPDEGNQGMFIHSHVPWNDVPDWCRDSDKVTILRDPEDYVKAAYRWYLNPVNPVKGELTQEHMNVHSYAVKGYQEFFERYRDFGRQSRWFGDSPEASSNVVRQFKIVGRFDALDEFNDRLNSAFELSGEYPFLNRNPVEADIDSEYIWRVFSDEIDWYNSLKSDCVI